MEQLLITLVVGAAGGLIAHRLRVPSGALLGSMVAVGIYNCLGFDSYMPVQARIGVQIVIGCLLGLRLNREAFVQLKTVIRPVLIIVPSLLTFGMVTGFILHKVFGFDVYTAFLSSTPGGLTELSLLAATLGGDGPKVAVMHTFRLITVVTTTPFIMRAMEKLLTKHLSQNDIQNEEEPKS